MSSYERTAHQAVIGQKMDGQYQKLLSDYERPIQKKLFGLKRKCAEAEKLSPELAEIPSAPQRQCEDLEYLFACAEQEVKDKVQVHELTRKSLNAAQLYHGYVGSNNDKSIVVSILTLLSMVFGEALLNAAFLSNAHMVAGPAAALLTSFLISMTNVAVCACAGFFIGRYLKYGDNALGGEESPFRKKRMKARFQFYGFLTLILFFHLTVGLVRAQETIDSVDHSLFAYLEMLCTPEAVFLILMGSCMSVIAYNKGIYSFDCPYPEIGQLQRAEATAKDDIQNTLDDFEEEITAYFEDAEKEQKSPSDTQRKVVDQYNKAVSACQEARRTLEQSVREAETACRGELAELITTYGCISGNEQDVPMETLQQMVSFDKYLDIEIPAYRAPPETGALKSDLLVEKNRAIRRLTQIFQSANHANGGKS